MMKEITSQDLSQTKNVYMYKKTNFSFQSWVPLFLIFGKILKYLQLYGLSNERYIKYYESAQVY